MTTRIAIAVARACLPLLLCIGTRPAAAQGWIGLLKNTPAEQFDDEDLRLFMDASRRALDETPERGTVSWENPATKSRGEVTVLSIFTWETHACRRLKVANQARGRKSSHVISLCRIDDRWRVVNASQLSG